METTNFSALSSRANQSTGLKLKEGDILGKGNRTRLTRRTPTLIPDSEARLPHGATSRIDSYREDVSTAYMHIGVAAVSHSSFEATVNRLLLSLSPSGVTSNAQHGREYLPSKNFEMTKNLGRLINSAPVGGNLLAQLKKLRDAEAKLRHLRNSVVHSFISDPPVASQSVLFFEDARSLLGPGRVRRTLPELARDSREIADRSAFLSAIAETIFGRIRVRYAAELWLPSETIPPVPVNSPDPDFARRFTAFMQTGQWLGWSTTALGQKPVHDDGWWLK